MPPKIGELPCKKTVSTRLDERDCEALNLVVSKSSVNQAEFIRRLIRQCLITNAEPPVV